MFSLFQLKKIFQLNDNFFYWLKITFLSLIIFGLILSLIVSPKDYLQGDTVRIMYVHVPASWLALMIFAAMGISSIITLVFKIRVFTIYAKSLAPMVYFLINFYFYRFVMGTTYLGNFLDVGCKTNIHACSVFFYIFYILS